jgi:glycosyltransferase involved in cell wall biosynthesis
MIETSLIILTRNEIEGVKSIISKIPFKSVDEYFAVDYKSQDGTVEYFKRNNIPVIFQTNPGRSEAFRIGRAKAKGKYLIFFSPDGNEDPSDIPKLIRLLKTGANIAIASRFLPNSRNEEDDKVFKWRAWANIIFTFIANILFNRKKYITDSINGYRAIDKKSFDLLHLDAEGFVIEYQMTIRAMRLGLIISEIPTYEGNRIGGYSTSYAIPTGIKFIQFLIREMFVNPFK